MINENEQTKRINEYQLFNKRKKENKNKSKCRKRGTHHFTIFVQIKRGPINSPSTMNKKEDVDNDNQIVNKNPSETF